MANGGFKCLPRRIIPDKILGHKELKVAKNKKYAGPQRRLTSMVYKLFDKKPANLTEMRINAVPHN